MPEFDTALVLLLAAIAVAGVARGLSGFGTGMIVAPVAGALYGPKAAVVIMVIIDSLPTIPITIPAFRLALWREVLPILAGMAVFLPAGVWILANGEPTTLRWIVCIAILICAAGLWLGWRYRGPRSGATSFGVGGIAGVLSGIASIPAPPVIFYWMATDLKAAIIRANLLVLFFLSEALSIANLWVAGLFEWEVVAIGLVAIPVYFVAMLAGQRLYGFASDQTYRRITFVLIVLSAILALPLMEPLFRALPGLAG